MKFRKNIVKNIIYGPIQSRRLGNDLGINPLNRSIKWCIFNCPYCQDGTSRYQSTTLPPAYPYPSVNEVCFALEQSLIELKNRGIKLDGISICGNGEPTLHPSFPRIVDETLALRDKHAKGIRLGVFSTGATLENPSIFDALLKVDSRYMKLDAGDETSFFNINRPTDGTKLRDIVKNLKRLSKQVPIIIQSMFISGPAENTNPAALRSWYETLCEICPSEIHIYTVDRKPADPSIQKVARAELDRISADGIEKFNLPICSY